MDEYKRLYDAVLHIHEKIDAQGKDIMEIKVAQEGLKVLNTRLKIVERIVYGMVAFILVAFMVALCGAPKKSTALPCKTIIEKTIEDIKK